MLLLLLACQPDSAPKSADTATPTTTTSSSTSTTPIPDGCRAAPPAADRDRPLLYSLPYDADANPSDIWGWRTLSTSGEISEEHGQIPLGRATYGRLVFTPDASLGLVPLEDGSLGVVTVQDDVPTAQPVFAGDFYATKVIMDPSGEFAWILDGDWVNNGGGVYRVAIDCDTGALTDEGLVYPAKLPADLLPLGDDRFVLLAREAGGAENDEANVIDLATGTWIAGTPIFDDEDALVSDAVLAGGYLLVADNSLFASAPNRIAVASVGSVGITTMQILSPFDDPFSLWPSPDGSRVLVASGYGDALLWLSATNDNETPYGSNGDIDYTGSHPALPGDIVGVQRGTLNGLAVLVENTGLRRVDLSGDRPEDLGLTSFGGGVEHIPGAIGLAP